MRSLAVFRKENTRNESSLRAATKTYKTESHIRVQIHVRAEHASNQKTNQPPEKSPIRTINVSTESLPKQREPEQHPCQPGKTHHLELPSIDKRQHRSSIVHLVGICICILFTDLLFHNSLTSHITHTPQIHHPSTEHAEDSSFFYDCPRELQNTP